MPKKTPYKQSRKDDDAVKLVVGNFETCWNYTRSNYHKTWEDAYKLYNNKRIKIGYEGYSDIFVPMTFSTIETMVSALAGGKPSFDFLAPKENPQQNTDILNALLDYYWDKDQWHIKIQSFIRSMLTYGTGVVYLYWDMDCPRMVNVPLRDFFFNPNASSIDSNHSDFYCGRRYLTTVDELKSYEVIDPETGETKPKYKNLDSIIAGSHGEETDKEKKDMFYGSTVEDPEHNQVEVIEYWTNDKVCSVANRSVLIQEDENPYKMQSRLRGDEYPRGIIPFVVQRDYVDESLFLGKGEIEVIADQQEWLNDLTNQNNDAITYTLNPMWNLNPNKSDMIEQVGAAPGRVFPLDANDLAPVPMPSIPSDAFNERLNIKNEIRETTAVDQVVKGVSTDTKTTATEINAQVASAGQRIGMKVTQLENEGFHRLARVVLQMVQLYITEPMMVRVVNEITSWEEFNPLEFQFDYEPRVQLQTTVDSKKEQEMNVAKEMYLALSVDPEVNQTELKKIALPKMFDLEPDEVERLLAPPEMDPMQDPMMPPVDPMMGMELMPEEMVVMDEQIV